MKTQSVASLELRDRQTAHILVALLIAGVQIAVLQHETPWGPPMARWIYGVSLALIAWLIIRNKPFVTEAPLTAILVLALSLAVGTALSDLGVVVWLATSIASLFGATLYNLATSLFYRPRLQSWKGQSESEGGP